MLELKEEVAIQLPEVTFRLRKQHLLAREIVAFRGASEARLDLLLRLLAGGFPEKGVVTNPRAGGVKARTMDLGVSGLPIHFKGKLLYGGGGPPREIGAVFGDPDLNMLGRTVLEEYLSGLAADGSMPAEESIAAAALRHYDLVDKLDRSTQVLSGGEKQRLSCATALAGNKSMFVGDFTATSLDSAFRQVLGGILKKFANAGGLVLLTGLHSTEYESFGVTRLLEATGVNGIVELRDVEKSDWPVRLARDTAEVQELTAAIVPRIVGEHTIVRAHAVHRPHLSLPVSLEIRTGEMVVLTGPNGWGKSTFGEILAGWLRRRNWLGTRVNWMGRLEVSEDVKVGMATQDPNHSLLGLTLERELPDIALREACGFDTQDHGNDPRGLPHGKKKLLAVANALRIARGLAILDEPTTGMDTGEKQRVVALCNTFPNLAVLVITHDPAVYSWGRRVELVEV